MNLIIDIGNTRNKVFVFQGSRIIAEYTPAKLSLPLLKKINALHGIEASIFSSVTGSMQAFTTFLEQQTKFIALSHKTPLPFRNLYRTRRTLGNDRIANAAGAAKFFPGKNCLVIDAGTCVKYDFINARNQYLGGGISPGLLMRYRALHEQTAKLPLVKPAKHIRLLGTDTESSIVSGVQQGMINEMEGYIRLYKKRYRTLKVIFTGGDADSFAHLFNFPIFAAPKLTATGLNEILQHNLKKK